MNDVARAELAEVDAKADQTRKREATLLATAVKCKEEEAVNVTDMDKGNNSTPIAGNDGSEVEDTGAGANNSNVYKGATKKTRKDKKTERKDAKRAREQQATPEKS